MVEGTPASTYISNSTSWPRRHSAGLATPRRRPSRFQWNKRIPNKDDPQVPQPRVMGFIATWPLWWCQGALQTCSVGDLARAGHAAVALRAAAPKRRWWAAVYRQSRWNTAGHRANLLGKILGSGQYREGFAVVALGNAGMGSMVAGPFPSAPGEAEAIP